MRYIQKHKTPKLMVFLLLIFLCSMNINGQWLQTDGPFGDRILSLAVCGNSILTGTHNGIYKTTNNGASWDKLNTKDLGTAKSIAVTTSNIYAASLSEIYVSNDTGITWSLVSAGKLQRDILALAAMDSQLFVSTNGGIYRLTDNSPKWDSLGENPNYLVYATALCASGNNLYAGTCGHVYHSANAALTWTEVGSALPGQINAITVADSFVYAAAYNTVYRSSVGSQTGWIAKDIGPLGLNILVLAQKGRHLYAGTTRGVFISSDSGNNWRAMNNGLENMCVSAFAISGEKCIAGTYGGVFLSTDNTLTWSAINNGITTSYACLGVQDSTLFVGTVGGGVVLSNDNGITWSTINTKLPNQQINTFGIYDSILFAGTATGIFSSEDKGNNWNESDSGIPFGDITAIAKLGTLIFAGSHGAGVYLSADNGKTWSTTDTTLMGKGIMSLTIQGTEVFAGTYEKGVYVSVDSGTSWTLASERKDESVKSGIGCPYIRSLYTTGNTLYAGTTNGLYISKDSGRTWIVTHTDQTGADPILFITSFDTILFAGTFLGVFYSQDQGASWRPMDTTHSMTGVMSLVVCRNDLFAGTYNRGTWKHSLSDISLKNSSLFSAKDDINLWQNTPNPFNPSTKIKYTLPDKEQGSIGIYTSTGNLLLKRSLKNSGVFQWDAHGKASGIYYCRLQVGKSVLVKKLLLMR